MRLINLNTQKLEEVLLEDVPLMSRFTAGAPDNVRAYATLSHTWTAGQEVSFTEYNIIQDEPMTPRAEELRLKSGYSKVQAFLAALADQQRTAPWLTFIKWAWIDTCCIDRSSSADLSEAINSMYQWYSDAAICFAYLEDVNAPGGLLEQNTTYLETSSFINGPAPKWFSRGWTLQELIAPKQLYFYDKNWRHIGSKTGLGISTALERVTGIPRLVLIGRLDCSSLSVAQRMQWASKRRTTRREDEAYCLLGIFDVNLPLLYGEGSKAFLRLQDAIMRVTNDHTIFAWTKSSGLLPGDGVLAQSVRDFQHCASIHVERAFAVTLGIDWFDNTLPHHKKPPLPYQLTNTGLQIQLPFADAPSHWASDGSTTCSLRCQIVLLNVARPNLRREEFTQSSAAAANFYVNHEFGCIYLRRRREDGTYVRSHVDKLAWLTADEVLSIFQWEKRGDWPNLKPQRLYLQAAGSAMRLRSLWGTWLPS